MTISIADLHNNIAAVCPIDGVSVEDGFNKLTWRVDYAPGVTQVQIDAALLVISNSDFVGPTPPPPPPSGSGATVLVEVEVFLGSVPRRSGRFSIVGTGLIIGRPVVIQKANGPYTGKGTLADEAEMDLLVVSGKVVSPTVIECFWNSASPVAGNFKFNYFVGA